MSKNNGFDGEAFGKEMVLVIRAAIDERVAVLEAKLIELGERVARIEGGAGEAKAVHKPKRITRMGGRK